MRKTRTEHDVSPYGQAAPHKSFEATFGILKRHTSARKTLILCPAGLGNFIMVSASLKRLHDEIGVENLHLLAVKPGIATFGAASGYFGQIFTWDPSRESKARSLQIASALRRQRYDFSLSLFPSAHRQFALLALLAGIKTRIGFRYPNSTVPAFLQQHALPLDLTAHDTDQNWELVEHLLGTTQPGPRSLHFPFEPRYAEREALRTVRYYVCHPGSSVERGMKEKRLPPQTFGEVGRRLYQEFGLKCLLVGGPEEAELRQEVYKQAPEAMLEFPSSNFHELGALLTHAQFYVGNDSGLMHMSVALGKRCIVFFGPTDEKRNGPYSAYWREGGKNPHLILRRDDLTCSPCWTIRTIGTAPPCVHGDIRCLKAFSLAPVWPQIRSFVAEVTNPQYHTQE